MARITESLRAWLLSALVLVLAGCGGGGGGDAVPGAGGALVVPLATLSQDIDPAGARIDVSPRNFFPLHAGDVWNYAKSFAGGGATTVVTRRVVAGPGPDGRVTVTEVDGAETETTELRITAAGVEVIDPLGAAGIWPGILAALPSYNEMPTPFYPVGGVRRTIRQGDMGIDLDADGRNDYYRIEITQEFLGFGSRLLFGVSRETADFRSRIEFTLVTTRDGASITATANEDASYVDGIGLVSATRSAIGPGGAVLLAEHTLTITDGTVNGRSIDGTRTVALTSAAMVFDATRNVYYASVPSSDVANGNRIATIDALTGAVAYSAAVGSNPGPMALSADGTTLYVGLLGSGDVVKLAAPGMTEQARVRLPVDGFYGQYQADDISISPVSNDVFAVALQRTGVSPRHAGVALVRNMVLEPRMTQSHTGSNSIGFEADGAWLIGYNLETTEHGLRRIEVVADGLVERTVVATNGLFNQRVYVQDGLAVVSHLVYAADASLALRATLPAATSCAKQPAVARIVCVGTTDSNVLKTFDATTFAAQSSLTFISNLSGVPSRIVFGATGQVAIRYSDKLILVDSPILR